MKNQKLTICFLGNAASVHTIKWARYFSEKSHKTHLLSFDLPETDDLSGIKLHVLKKKIPTTANSFYTLINLLFSLKRVRETIKETNPDIINSHYITSYGILAALAGFHPFVVTAWGTDILVNPERNLVIKRITQYVLKKADLITCDAEHMKEAMIDLGADESKIKIINFGIDTQRFSPGPSDEKLKKELKINGFGTVISLRRLESIYNIETLIRSAPIVFEKIPKTKFLIVGVGSQKRELKKLSENLKISNNIKFLGRIPNTELPRYLRISDVYISTSLSDGGIAASTAEAMACRVPVIITDTGENKKWITDGENGFIIPPKNSHILAEKIIYLLKNENERQKFGERGRKIIEERNDYHKEMAKMEEIYYELVLKNKNDS